MLPQPEKVCIELFAGSSRLTAALRRRDGRVGPAFDIAGGPQYDLIRRTTQDLVVDLDPVEMRGRRESALGELGKTRDWHELGLVDRGLGRGSDLDVLPVIVLLRPDLRLPSADQVLVHLGLVGVRVLNRHCTGGDLCVSADDVVVEVLHGAFLQA